MRQEALVLARYSFNIWYSPHVKQLSLLKYVEYYCLYSTGGTRFRNRLAVPHSRRRLTEDSLLVEVCARYWMYGISTITKYGALFNGFKTISLGFLLSRSDDFVVRRETLLSVHIR